MCAIKEHTVAQFIILDPTDEVERAVNVQWHSEILKYRIRKKSKMVEVI